MRVKRIVLPRGAATTTPGYVNPHGQRVLAATGAASAVRAGQTVYRLKCGRCGLEYGCAGIDVKDRRCPGCQGGTEGEALRERADGPGLFGEGGGL